MATSNVASSIAGLLRLAAWVICLIVIASFVVFVVDQTSSASSHQQEELNNGAPPATTTQGGPGAKASSKHKSTLHKTLDEASDELTSPFAGIVSDSSSKWAIHGVRTVLALLVYGFGLGYLARVLRVRV